MITAAELLAGVTDVDGPALSITALAVQSGQGSLVDNGDGTWSYTPALNDDSAVTFSYTASDGTLTASSTATLDLTSVNDAPITDHVLINTNKNTPIPGELGATDVDGGDTIVFSVETDPQHGTLDLHPDGSYASHRLPVTAAATVSRSKRPTVAACLRLAPQISRSRTARRKFGIS